MRCTTCSKEYLPLELMQGDCITCLWNRSQKAQQAIALVLPELRRLAEHYTNPIFWRNKPNAFQAMVEILEQAK